MKSKKGWTEEERDKEEAGSNEDLISLDYRNGDDRSACERRRPERTRIIVYRDDGWGQVAGRISWSVRQANLNWPSEAKKFTATLARCDRSTVSLIRMRWCV